MKPSNWMIRCSCSPSAKARLAALGFCGLVGVWHAQGQSVLAPPPPLSVTPPAMQEFQTNRAGATQIPDLIPTQQQQTTPFRWGPINIHPHMFYRFLYGDGIPAAPGQNVTTAINEIAPGVLFDIGRHFTLDYTPTLRYYSSTAFQNALDQNVIFTGATAYEDWILGLSQSYILSSTPQLATGSPTTEESFLTLLKASYRFNSKMSMDLAVNQTFTSPEGSITNLTLTGYREWSTMDWLNYQLWPKLDASLGAGFGYLDVDTGSDSTYERLEARISWRATDKTSLQVHGGAEDRQFLSGGADNLLNPVYGLSIVSRPFEYTALSLTFDRTVTASYFDNQITENITFSGNLNQRLLEKLFLSLGGGYSRIKYVSSAPGTTAGREDNYVFFNTRLTWTMFKRATFAVIYQFSDDNSNEEQFSVSGSQVGLELGYRY
jgi:hypothetical protein